MAGIADCYKAQGYAVQNGSSRSHTSLVGVSVNTEAVATSLQIQTGQFPDPWLLAKITILLTPYSILTSHLMPSFQ